MTAFIIRPFGTRKGVDFERIERELIGPALDGIKASGRTTGEILEAGNIRVDMFQRLLVADLVIADITTNNPNAFYELGIRHALQAKRTFLIRAKLPAAQTVQEVKETEVPFDIKTDRYLEYDPENPAASLQLLTEALRRTAANEGPDSPVFLSLPKLESQRRENFLPVPLDFGEEVERAKNDKDARKLTLLGLEARGFPWESTGLRAVGHAQLDIKRFGAAQTAWESLRKLDNFDLEANIALATIYQRLDDLTRSDQALERALRAAHQAADLAEVHGQLGRNKKDRWIMTWIDAQPEDRARNALDSPLLLEAYEQYLAAYRHDLSSYYPGLNALGLAKIIVDLASLHPEAWNGQFGDDGEANGKLAFILRKGEQIEHALQLRFDAADTPLTDDMRKDQWFLSSAGDFHLLSKPNARRAISFYKKAAETVGDFVLDAARRQLTLFAQLGILKDRIDEVLAAFPPDRTPPVKERLDRVLLFTGHRIDARNRQKPRFPAAKEQAARDAIRAAVSEEKFLARGPMRGVSGGANGGDILFLEVCDELNVETEMLLALPENRFIAASVDNEDKSWLRRFDAQSRKHSQVPILATDSEMPEWLQFRADYDIWQRNNLWLLSEALCLAPKNLIVIALWDGESGDGPGGTEHMVSLAEERGARVISLNTKELFELD